MNLTRWVWLIVIVHVVLAAGYARVTPYRQAGVVIMQGGVSATDIGAPDESRHVNYVTHLLSGRGFPVFNPEDPNLGETYQSHQPPLFYLAAAGWARLTGQANLETQHAGLMLRLLNALIGGAGVVGVFFLALWGFGNRPQALAACVIAALLPMNVALSGAVSNDPLLIALCSWCLALCARAMRQGWSLKLALGVGLLTGLALLTKTTAIALIPAVVLAGVLRPDDSGRFIWWDRRSVRWVLVALGLAVILGLPWWIRNQSLYGDPLAMKAFNQAFTGSMQASTVMEKVGGPYDYWVLTVGRFTAFSFFGIFGYWDIWFSAETYYAAGACTALLAIGWVFSLRGRRVDWPLHLLNGLFLLLIVAAFVRFNMQYFQAQGRYLLPALGPIAVGLAGGLCHLFRRRAEYAALGLALVLLAVNGYVVRFMLPSEFAARLTPPPASSPGTR